MKTKRNSFLMFVMGLGISFSAQAEVPVATLSQVEGVVLVNQGKQFTRARSGMSLSAGDRILTMRGSQVSLNLKEYECSSFLGGNSLLTITKQLNCKTLTQQEMAPRRYAALGEGNPAAQGGSAGGAAGATGGGAAAAGAATGDSIISGISTTELLVAGGVAAAVGTGVGVGLAVTSDGDNPPLSVQ